MRTNLAFMDVIFANFIKITGLRSNHPSEACEHYYFSPHTWTVSILVAENRSTPCPFSGSYRVDGQVNHMVYLFETNSLPKLVSEEIVENEELEEKPVDRQLKCMQGGCRFNSQTF